MNPPAAMPRAHYIAGIFEEHLEELAFLWARWRGALRDPRYTLADVGALEERIRARLDGARVPGARAWPRLAQLLHGADAELAFSAACVLLSGGDSAREDDVLAAFVGTDDARFFAQALALEHAPLAEAALDRVRVALSAGPAARAVAAARVLAMHGVTPGLLDSFMEDGDARVRAAGWRTAALAGVEPSPAAFARAMRDGAPPVTHAALEAGAWCRVPGVLPALRQLAEAPSPRRMDVLYLLAVLGTEQDTPRIRTLVAMEELGPERFCLAGASGDPGVMNLVLAGMEHPDAATASAAGAAFTRLTGVEAASGACVFIPPADGPPPDEFEAEFLESAVLPDASAAQRAWEAMGLDLVGLPRIRHGMDASHAPTDDLDMESRHDALLRRRFHDGWEGTARTLEVFPQATP